MSKIKTDTIEGITTDGALTLTPNGTGGLVTDHWTWPLTDGTANQLLETDGSGNLDWVAAGSGALVYITSVTASAGASIDFDGSLTSTYDRYLFVGTDIYPSTDAQYLTCRTDTAGGASWDAGVTILGWLVFIISPLVLLAQMQTLHRRILVCRVILSPAKLR